MENYEKHLTYMRGWRDGAGCRAMNPRCTEHTNKEIVDTYEDGYTKGQFAARKASEVKSKELGVNLGNICLRDTE